VNGVFALAFPAHATNIVQALHLICFGPFKKLKASAFGEVGDNSVNDQSIELVQAHQQTATSITIHGSFLEARMTPETS
jgi:hypothetical protein